jgi:hypothetical protein
MKNVALLVVSLIFVAMGLFLLVVGKDWRMAVGCVGFFGACAFVFAVQISDERRETRWREVDGNIAFAGPVELRESRARAWMPIVVVSLVGVCSLLFGYERNGLMLAIGALLVAGAPILAVLMMLGVIGRDAITIDDTGLRFTRRRQVFHVGWNDIAGIRTGAWNGHVLVFLAVHDVDKVAATANDHAARLRKQMMQSVALMGAPLMIWAQRMGVDGEPLARSLARYVGDPRARAELRRNPQLQTGVTAP